MIDAASDGRIMLPLREKCFTEIDIMKIAWLVTIAIFMGAATVAEAANWYVRAGATGAKTGSDWTNAYSSLPATLVRGDTYYIAAGTYGAYRFSTANSGSTVVTIRKATVGNHGSSTGWNDVYGSGEAVFTSSGTTWTCAPSVGFVTIDGQRGTPGVVGSYGFRVTSTASRNGANALFQIDTGGTFSSSGNCDNWIVKYVDFDWNNGTSAGSSGAGRCIQWNSGLKNDNTTFDHIWCHHSSGFGIYANAAGSNYVITNSRFSDNGGESSYHHETLWNTDINGFTFVGNEIIDTKPGAVTGWLMMGNITNGLVANNLFYCTDPAKCTTGGNGIIASWTAYSNSNVTIVNNTFANLPSSGNPAIFFENTTNFTCRNNLVYTASFGWTGCTVNTNNACGGGAGCGGTSAQTGLTTAIFRDWASKDLHLTADTQTGFSMSTVISTDKDGTTRLSWDRGAYEFNNGSATIPPPSNLRTAISQ